MAEIKTFETGTYGTNCSVITEENKVWIVDPGADAQDIIGFLKERALELKAVILTHAHFDHIGAIPEFEKAFPALKVYVHPSDVPMFGHPLNQNPPDYPSVGKPNSICDAGSLSGDVPFAVSVIETPGHTPGGVCYYLPDLKVLLAGDTLFAGSVGRTDLPGGDMAKLALSLKELRKLPDETRVVPGHGPQTTIGAERRSNPYVLQFGV